MLKHYLERSALWDATLREMERPNNDGTMVKDLITVFGLEHCERKIEEAKNRRDSGPVVIPNQSKPHWTEK